MTRPCATTALRSGPSGARRTGAPSRRTSGPAGRASALFVLALLLSGTSAVAQNDRPEIWDTKIGTKISDTPSRNYRLISCGTDGGPPSKPLDDFGRFGECPPEASGLREVYFEYDNELEYIARAHEDLQAANRLGGTRVFGYQSIVSVLVDPGGVIRGVRIVSDPRASDMRERTSAVSLGQFVKAHFKEEGWACTDQPKRERFEPAMGMFVDQLCEKTEPETGHRLTLTMHHFRKPGQYALDPVTRKPLPGNLESSTRLEIYEPRYAPGRDG